MTPQVMLLAGGVLLALGTGVLGVVLADLRSERSAVTQALAVVRGLDVADEIDSEQPFTQRVLAPFAQRLVGLGRRLVRADAAERLQHRLDVAGNPAGWDVGRLLGAKALCLFGLAAAGLLYSRILDLSLMGSVALTLAAGLVGFVVPNLLLFNAGQKREQQMQRTLPDAFDLMTVSVEAGLGFDAAVAKVATNTRGPLAMEFARLLQELQIGTGRADAMRALAGRTTLADLKSFSLAIVQAEQLGAPLGRVLRVQSREIRVKRRQRAEEQAQKVPVKIMVPLVLFVLPCLLIVVAGPAMVNMVGVFG